MNQTFFLIIVIVVGVLGFFSIGELEKMTVNSEYSSVSDYDKNMVFEIAWFEIDDDVPKSQIINGAQKIQDEFLPSYDGIIYREFLQSSEGIWFDTIHWDSESSFYKASQDVFTHSAPSDLLSLIKPGTLVWFHGFLLKSWGVDIIDDSSNATQISVFRIHNVDIKEEFVNKVTDEEFLDSSDVLQTEFISKQKGFVNREIFKTKDGWFLELIHWNGLKDAQNAKIRLMENFDNPTIQNYYGKIDPKSLKSFLLDQIKIWHMN